MKVSLNWLREFTEITLPIDELVAKIGAQLGAVEEVEYLGDKYEDILVVKVVGCVPHPNADKLKVCKIDDAKVVKGVKRDQDGLVELVCGAPNVKTDMLAVWLPPGVTVPSSVDKEDELVLEARPIRGVVSNGMLASASELAISDDHSGIVSLESDAKIKPGDLLTKVLKLDDYIIDIENKMFTHRPDLFGQLGVAREVAGIQGKQFKSPSIYKDSKVVAGKAGLPLEIKVELPDKVPRFVAEVYENVQVKPSPLWLQSYLSRVGVRPINNIVDITNYMMVLTGQPMHAYDYDKLKGTAAKPQIVVRRAKPAETLTLLNGKQFKPGKDDIMIASQSELIGVGGVMGGRDTEVDENTKHIILECATFDMYSIRRTAMEHGLFTDAVTRFTKGQSPLQNNHVVAWARGEIIRETGGTPTTLVDVQHNVKEPKPVKVDSDFINVRLGESLSAEQMAKLLTNVEFEVKVAGNELNVSPPFWRTDIEIPEDVVEEIGRLYGYDHLSLELPRRTAQPAAIDELLDIKSKLRDVLSRAGANEVLTYTFVPGDLMDKVGQNPDNAFQVTNALSPDLQYYRQSLIPSLLEKVHPNIKAGFKEFALFEMNPVHGKDLMSKDDKLPIEDQRLALVFAADDKTAKQQYGGAAYYQAMHYLLELLKSFGLSELEFQPASTYKPKLAISQAAIAPFEKSRTSLVKTKDGQFIAELGEFRAAARSALKLPKFVAGFELDVSQLLKLQSKKSSYVPIPRFPKVEQDITLRVPINLTHQEVISFFWGEYASENPEDTVSTLTSIDVYKSPKDTKCKNITLRFTLASRLRTLTATEVNALLDKIAKAAKTKLGAERI